MVWYLFSHVLFGYVDVTALNVLLTSLRPRYGTILHTYLVIVGCMVLDCTVTDRKISEKYMIHPTHMKACTYRHTI